MKPTKILIASMLSAAFMAAPAHADKLDDIMASGTLRCAVTLDFPPMGSRDKDNTPIGFDEAIRLEQDVKKWNDPNGSFRAYQSVADPLLALAQGQIDASLLHHRETRHDLRAPAELAHVQVLRTEAIHVRYIDVLERSALHAQGHGRNAGHHVLDRARRHDPGDCPRARANPPC